MCECSCCQKIPGSSTRLLLQKCTESSRHRLLKYPFPGDPQALGCPPMHRQEVGTGWELCTWIAPRWGRPFWIGGLAVVPVILTTHRAATQFGCQPTVLCQRLFFLRSGCFGSVPNGGLLRGDTWRLCVLSMSFSLQPHSHLVQPQHL